MFRVLLVTCKSLTGWKVGTPILPKSSLACGAVDLMSPGLSETRNLRTPTVESRNCGKSKNYRRHGMPPPH